MDEAQNTKAGTASRKQGQRTIDVSRLFERLPPFAPEAEMGLLGSLILDPHVASEVLMYVSRPDQFYVQAHQVIFETLMRVYEAHVGADLVGLSDALRQRGALEDIGGADYLVRLAESVPSAANAQYYAKLVADKSKLRRLIDACGEALYEAYHASDYGLDGASEVLDRTEQAIFAIAEESQRIEPQRLSDLLMDEMTRLQNAEGKDITGVPTGFLDLDKTLSGLQPGELVILAGRPSMGKTAIALNLAEQIAFGGRTPWTSPVGKPAPVAFFSLEMSKSSVTQRLLSAYTGISATNIRTGALSKQEFGSIVDQIGDLASIPLFIDDTPGLTIMGLRARARRMVAQYHIKAIFIDYLQLLTAPQQSRESRQVEVSAISRGIKSLARELNVPVICLSQLNRGSEQREGHRPRMSDLRESGSIEQDADVIILIHREEYYHQADPSWAQQDENQDKLGLTELIVAKQRNGPTGVVKLTWDPDTTRFKSHAGGWEGEYRAVEAKPNASNTRNTEQRQSDGAFGFGDEGAFDNARGSNQPPRTDQPSQTRSAFDRERDDAGSRKGYSSSGPGLEREEDVPDDPSDEVPF